MAILNVNPTRMELSKLKKQYGIAKRGHKLLKDKQDEMIRQFMLIIKHNRALRIEVENELMTIGQLFSSARLKMSYEGIMEALMVPSKNVNLKTGFKSIMNIDVPSIKYDETKKIDLTYGFAHTPGELDEAVIQLSKLLTKMVELAQIEKTCDMLAKEIEKTRRRVNAIEFVMLPNMEESIRYITMKLEDNERSSIIRLMKSKEIILKKENK